MGHNPYRSVARTPATTHNDVLVQRSSYTLMLFVLFVQTTSGSSYRLNLDVDITGKLSGLNTRPRRFGCGKKLCEKSV